MSGFPKNSKLSIQNDAKFLFLPPLVLTLPPYIPNLLTTGIHRKVSNCSLKGAS